MNLGWWVASWFLFSICFRPALLLKQTITPSRLSQTSLSNSISLHCCRMLDPTSVISALHISKSQSALLNHQTDWFLFSSSIFFHSFKVNPHLINNKYISIKIYYKYTSWQHPSQYNMYSKAEKNHLGRVQKVWLDVTQFALMNRRFSFNLQDISKNVRRLAACQFHLECCLEMNC